MSFLVVSYYNVWCSPLRHSPISCLRGLPAQNTTKNKDKGHNFKAAMRPIT